MSDNIIHLNEAALKGELKNLVRNSVEKTLNELLNHEADRLVNAQRYERNTDRKDYRSGHYDRNFTTTSGNVTLHVPKLKGITFETAIIERYCRRETSIEEALIEMYLAGVSFLVAIGVDQNGYREILGAAEGMKEDYESWKTFLLWLKERGLKGVRLFIGDKNLGMLETIGEVFPDAKYQRCIVHFYRNVFSVVPKGKMREVAMMLKVIHAQENKKAAREKAKQVTERLKEMKLGKAAEKVEASIEETLTFMDFPSQHWTRIRTNNMLERVNREIKRRTRAIGAFPDGNSALMLVCARLRYVAGSSWGEKRYMNMEHLLELESQTLVG